MGAVAVDDEGSPPHRRGKVGLDGGLSEAVGITPAQAGKSKLALCTPSCPTDHPCAGGEKYIALSEDCLNQGSPPRGRGKGAISQRNRPCPRITPAWAGKSGKLYRRHMGAQDHPRRAGKITCTNTRFRFQEDHPRMGGEKANGSDAPDDDEGSPPRRRGKVGENHLVAQLPGITPAWAGKSLFCFTAAVPIQDHPRTGREKVTFLGGRKINPGSPPHRRGKVSLGENKHFFVGITPAQAGKSSARFPHRTSARDHPRIGGEKCTQPRPAPTVTGSPPHRRGKGTGR